MSRKTVTVNFFEQNILNIQYSFDATIKLNIYDDLYIDFSEIDAMLNSWKIKIPPQKVRFLDLTFLEAVQTFFLTGFSLIKTLFYIPFQYH